MAECSGSSPLKGLLNHNVHDHIRRPDSTTPASQTFRSQEAVTHGQSTYTSFFVEGKSIQSSRHTPHFVQGSKDSSFTPAKALGSYPVVCNTNEYSSSLKQLPSQSASAVPQVLGSEWIKEFTPVSAVRPIHQRDAGVMASDQSTPTCKTGIVSRSTAWPNLCDSAPALPPAASGATNIRYLGRPPEGWNHDVKTGDFILHDVDDVLNQIADELDHAATVLEARDNSYAAPGVPMDVAKAASLQNNSCDQSAEEVDLGRPPDECTRSEPLVTEIAKKILASVDHEQGIKWQQSSFLALMRDFRDGKKDIVDNRIR